MLSAIKRVFGLGSKKVMQHPTLGQLQYFEWKTNQDSYWLGSVGIEGQANEATLRIQADEDGPSQGQEQFIRNIVDHLDSLVPLMSAVVKPSFEIWCETRYEDGFLEAFECTNLVVPNSGSLTSKWALSFARRDDNDFVFSVFFENGVAVNTDLDG